VLTFVPAIHRLAAADRPRSMTVTGDRGSASLFCHPCVTDLAALDGSLAAELGRIEEVGHHLIGMLAKPEAHRRRRDRICAFRGMDLKRLPKPRVQDLGGDQAAERSWLVRSQATVSALIGPRSRDPPASRRRGGAAREGSSPCRFRPPRRFANCLPLAGFPGFLRQLLRICCHR